MVKTRSLFVALTDTVDSGDGPREQPLAFIEVLEFHGTDFGHSRVVAIDPRNLWARFPQHLQVSIAEVKDKLLGTEYSVLQHAGDAVHMAFFGSTADVFHAGAPFKCLLAELHAKTLRQLRAPGRVERVPSAWQWVDSRFLPECASLPVEIILGESRHDPPGAVWLPFGPLRPVYPMHASNKEVADDIKRMQITGFEKRTRIKDLHERVEEGEILEAGDVRAKRSHRSKRKAELKCGKEVFIDEAYITTSGNCGGSMRAPHVIIYSGYEAPAMNGSKAAACPASQVAELRSLADGSVRSVPREVVKPLVSLFSQRCQDHFCVSEPLCTSCAGMIKAVQSRCAKRTPPVPFATGWRELNSSMDPPALTEQAYEGGLGAQAMDAASEDTKASGKRIARAHPGMAMSVSKAGSQSWSEPEPATTLLESPGGSKKQKTDPSEPATIGSSHSTLTSLASSIILPVPLVAAVPSSHSSLDKEAVSPSFPRR